MQKLQSLASASSGALVAALLYTSTPASSQVAVYDAAMNSLQSTFNTIETGISSTVTTIFTALGVNGPLYAILTAGFTQNANYAKAAVDAHTQIADASNNAMAGFFKNLYNVKVGDQHATNPVHCTALDSGQSVTQASTQSFNVYASVAQTQDQRGEARQNMPAYYGTAQAIAAVNGLHYSRYCNADEAAAGLCGTSQNPNADQEATSLFGNGNLTNQTGVNAAADYITTLAQPIVPAALRGDQLTSETGKEMSARRRRYNAQQSMAKNMLDFILAIQSPTITLNADQQRQLQNVGLTPPAQGSWLQAMVLDANRRVSDVNWASQVQAMPPASIEREIAHELGALINVETVRLQVDLRSAAVNAALLAETVEDNYPRSVKLPTPNLVSN
jgi:hypothetical protein